MTNPGTRLREARERAGVRLSAMAAPTEFCRTELASIEAGRRRMTPDVVLACERALAHLVNRHGVLTGMAADAVARIATWELIHEGFAAAANPVQRSVDGWQAQGQDAEQKSINADTAALQQRLAGDLVLLQQHVEAPALWGTAGRLLSSYSRTSGRATGPVRWYRLAVLAADRSENLDVRVWVRGRAAFTLATEPAAQPLASELAQEALALARQPSMGRLNALLALALISGDHDDRTRALTYLDQASRMFDLVGSSDPTNEFAYPRMTMFSSALHWRLGDSRTASA
jgi:helix-turn-helix protein